MKHYLLVLPIIFSMTVRGEWLCTEEASQRINNEIRSCGIGEGKTENEARLTALDNAKKEFDRLCSASDDCKGYKVLIDPKRTECRRREGSFICYRLISFSITTEAKTGEHAPDKKMEVARSNEDSNYCDTFPVNVSNVDNIAHYLNALVDITHQISSLQARTILQAAVDLDAKNELLTLFKRSERDLRCFSQQVAPYLKSSDTKISQSAQEFIEAIGIFADRYAGVSRKLTGELNGEKERIPAGVLAERDTNLQLHYERGLTLLFKATLVTTGACGNQKSGEPGTIILKKRDLSEIEEKTKIKFGSKRKGADEEPFSGTARLLADCLKQNYLKRRSP